MRTRFRGNTSSSLLILFVTMPVLVLAVTDA